MRVMIITEVYLPKVDGVVHRTMNLIRHLRDRNDEVLVVCPQTSSQINSPVNTVSFPSFPFPAYPEYGIGMPDGRLIEAVESFQPDIIHFINPFAFGFRCSDLLADAGCRRPTLYSFHTLYGEFVKKYRWLAPMSRLLWRLMREYHNRADRNLTVSDVMIDDLRREGFERVALWPPAVDCNLFAPRSENEVMRRRLLGDPSDRRLLLTVSRLAPEKNVAFLAPVVRRLKNTRLVIVGDGPQRSELERVFADVDARFVGYLRGQELAAAYAAADAFVYASETETMGNVILEAMSSQLAIVAPRAGGIRSLIDDGKNGLLFQPGNLDEATNATARVLDDEALRHRLALAARSQVESWGWDRSVAQVRCHYHDAINEFHAGRRPTHVRRSWPRWTVRALVTAFRATAACTSFRPPVESVPENVTTTLPTGTVEPPFASP